MDQQEKDWLRLGQKLRNYQPAGDPAADFARLQELQQEASRPAQKRWLMWTLLGLLIMATGSWWLLREATPQLPATSFPIATSENTTNTEAEVPTAITTIQAVVGETLGQVEKSNRPAGTAKQVLPVEERHRTTQAGNFPTGTTPPLKSATPKTTIPPEQSGGQRQSMGVSRIDGESAKLMVSRDLPDVIITPPLTQKVIQVTKATPRLSFGGGLSTHWRGDQFLSDTDLGVYVSLGIQQRIGERFLIAGRVGYRGHNLNLQVLEEEKPWSHYEEKTNEIDDNGEEVEYTYVGVVDGYKGIEFSVLLQYQMNNRTTLQAGGRYSLPSLAFRRTVHSSRDGDVTSQPNPYHFFATQQPLVKYYDYGALLGAQYQINNTLSFEAQLHLGMVDLIEDAGERRERFNHSSSLSLGLRYRLN